MTRSLLRGVAILSPAMILGVLIARYVPPRVIGIGTALLTLFMCYLGGQILNWPWKKRRP